MEAQVEAEAYRPYRDVLYEAGVRILASLGVEAPSPLPASLPAWRPFAEVPAALKALADHEFRAANSVMKPSSS